MTGPEPDLNFGGLKNNQDGLCVHSQDSLAGQAWGYYDGPRDTKDPEEAFPHWKHEDASLTLRCQPRQVRLDSRLEADPARAPMLRRLYRRTGRLIRSVCGAPLVRGKLNMEVWRVDVRCGGESCHRTDVTINTTAGRVSNSHSPRCPSTLNTTVVRRHFIKQSAG